MAKQREKQQESRKETMRIFPSVEDIGFFLAIETGVFIVISFLSHYAYPANPLGVSGNDLLTILGIIFTPAVALNVKLERVNEFLQGQLNDMRAKSAQDPTRVLDIVGYNNSYVTATFFKDCYFYFFIMAPLFIVDIFALIYRVDHGLVPILALVLFCLFMHSIALLSSLTSRDVLERIKELIEKRRSGRGESETMGSVNELSIKAMMVAVQGQGNMPGVQRFRERFGLEGVIPAGLARYSIGKGHILRLISAVMFYFVVVLYVFGNCIYHWDFTLRQLLVMFLGMLLGSGFVICFWLAAPVVFFKASEQQAVKVYKAILSAYSSKTGISISWMTVRAFSPLNLCYFLTVALKNGN
ncbi:hypothetical protein P4N68_11605 [Corynebacterium felinum]|uniref:Uncharacterized protein n=1 Tax=Corynebacterium felinum TaxID=131318 RepID=A0ABU2B9D9_9CORY|nr:hypothetical protein [Corynebacterium felinum]MDF5821715.1 hypothetical protein [Corynebacterium felinum]MDR7355265.1 hypothetical protein [Corynebacterium felinum]WJY94618.1 hypothetical protein CFELI_04945 [Corynebacterium felinum]